tara:strand:- start:186 stop:491 length:306 start_codon:yes stop_codon:yes gene_type:complete
MMGKKAEVVWKYLLDNRLATPSQVSKDTGVSYAYVQKLMGTIGTPKEIFEAEAKAQSDFDKAIVNAPIRPNTVNVWKDRVLQILVVVAITIVIGSWLYMVW